jgi:hypothetical protein
VVLAPDKVKQLVEVLKDKDQELVAQESQDLKVDRTRFTQEFLNFVALNSSVNSL